MEGRNKVRKKKKEKEKRKKENNYYVNCSLRIATTTLRYSPCFVSKRIKL